MRVFVASPRSGTYRYVPHLYTRSISERHPQNIPTTLISMDPDRNRYSLSRFTVEEDSMAPNFDLGAYSYYLGSDQLVRRTFKSSFQTTTRARLY